MNDLSETFRTTTDTFTGKKFRWNTTVFVTYGGRLPCRCTSRTNTWLAPDRVPAKLLNELNPKETA